MKINEIKEILKGTFSIEDERKYWEYRLKEEELKEERGKQNDIYFRVNAKYNR